MPLNQTHKALVRANLRDTDTDKEPRKKRRQTVRSHLPSIDVYSQSTDDFDDIDPEDVDLDAIASNEDALTSPLSTDTIEKGPRIANLDSTFSGSDSEFNSDDLEDLEDVDLEPIDTSSRRRNIGNETLTFSIKNGENEPKESTKKRSFIPISKDERKKRKIVHKATLFLMICHGAIRNKWCSDERLLRQIKKIISRDIVDLFNQDEADVLDFVKAKRFVDGLRKLSSIFLKKFKVTSPGLQRKNWGSKYISKDKKNKELTYVDFQRCVRKFQGSRDVGAQAFVAVLRSINVNARLVFSVQVPDFRSTKPVEVTYDTYFQEQAKPKSEFDPVFIPNARQAFLSGVRSQKKKRESNKEKQAKGKSIYPIFWIEVWNKYSRKWITVDPIVFNTVEVIPMRRKCKFEAPNADETHQTWYVIAYDEHGTVKDVTRRYTQFYNAKTLKKRIGFLSEKDENWYGHMLSALNRSNSSMSFAEAVELKEFHDRHICEGTPNNMADFKNHPVYVLNSQLRQDEIIYPYDETSKCGTFRSSNKSSIVPIYKRSCVYRLKSPRAWHMCGRVLKLGVHPLKTKQGQAEFMEEGGDDDGQVRLYAEFQTEICKPPPIVDGKIAKNAYGNVEIFRPHMVPENGFLVEITPQVSMRMLEKAAKWILNIDYARAIVSFEFGKAQKIKRVPTAKEGGILIDQQYKEAMLAVVEGLKDQQDQERREAAELNALCSWNFFLKKLQIIKRLDRNHGKVVDDNWLDKKQTKETLGGNGEVGYYNIGSESEKEEGGGFLAEFEGNGFYRNSDNDYDAGEILPETSDDEGGFLQDSQIILPGSTEKKSTQTFKADAGSADKDNLSLHLRLRLRHAQANETSQKRTSPVTYSENVINLNSDKSPKFLSPDLEIIPSSSREEYFTDENISIKKRNNNENSEFVDIQDEEDALGIEYSD